MLFLNIITTHFYSACTSAMLKVLYKDHKDTSADLSFQQTLLAMREILKQGRYTQIPQLSSSRPMDIHTPFDVVPEKCTGTRRAVMIGWVCVCCCCCWLCFFFAGDVCMRVPMSVSVMSTGD